MGILLTYNILHPFQDDRMTLLRELYSKTWDMRAEGSTVR